MPEPKKKMGRPPHQPTARSREQVEVLVAIGNTVEEIGLVMGIHGDTLQLHYAEELATGRFKVNQRIVENLIRQALKDDIRAFPAIKFYMNCKMGWSEYAPSKAADILGKKEIAQMEAQTAEAGTGWAHLVH